jgi:hypothetical protein
VDGLLILAIVGASTVLVAAVGRRRGLIAARRWRPAVLGALALLGASAAFFVLNLAIGVALALAVRTLTPFYLSVYFLNDLALLGLSLVQGLVFGLWYASGVAGRP